MSAGTTRTSLVLWAIGPIFLGVAAWLAFASPSAEIPVGEVRLVPLDQIAPGQWRKPLTSANDGVINGAVRPCSECHKLFGTPAEDNRKLIQHKDVVLQHGMNKRCLNCHFGEDRDKLVLHDGTLVDFKETPQLCSQCHGTVYRDWQMGTHGKTMDGWDPSLATQRRLTCNECHDPHSPRYKPLTPLPGPSTMRMGDQTRHHDPAEKHAPLRRWSQPKPEHEGPGEKNEHMPEHGEKGT